MKPIQASPDDLAGKLEKLRMRELLPAKDLIDLCEQVSLCQARDGLSLR